MVARGETKRVWTIFYTLKLFFYLFHAMNLPHKFGAQFYKFYLQKNISLSHGRLPENPLQPFFWVDVLK